MKIFLWLIQRTICSNKYIIHNLKWLFYTTPFHLLGIIQSLPLVQIILNDVTIVYMQRQCFKLCALILNSLKERFAINNKVTKVLCYSLDVSILH